MARSGAAAHPRPGQGRRGARGPGRRDRGAAKVRELVQVRRVNPRAANHGFCGRYTGMSPYDLAYSKSSGMFTSVYNRMLAIMDGKQ